VPVAWAAHRAEKAGARYNPPPRPATLAERAATVAAMDSSPAPAPAPERPVRTASLAPTPVPERPAKASPAAASAAARGGWAIQIGAFGAESEARAKLDLAQTKARSVLGDADPYTEKTMKGSTALYRARFAGFDEKGAKAACRLLQRNAFACMTIRN